MGSDGRRNLMRLLKLGFSGNLLERLDDLRWIRRTDLGAGQILRVRGTRRQENPQRQPRKPYPALLSITGFGGSLNLSASLQWWLLARGWDLSRISNKIDRDLRHPRPRRLHSERLTVPLCANGQQGRDRIALDFRFDQAVNVLA